MHGLVELQHLHDVDAALEDGFLARAGSCETHDEQVRRRAAVFIFVFERCEVAHDRESGSHGDCLALIT